MGSQPTVYIVDDDQQIRELLDCLVRSVGLNAMAFASAEEFLARYPEFPDSPMCLVMDVRLPGLSGLGLQRELGARGISMPVIMMSAYSDVPMAVQAMSAGAMDFLEKPFDRQYFVRRVMEALDRNAQQRLERARRAELTARIATLSSREFEVMEMLALGKQAKHIATEFRIGEKTVLKHRAKILEKMKVETVAELVRLLYPLGELPRPASFPHSDDPLRPTEAQT